MATKLRIAESLPQLAETVYNFLSAASPSNRQLMDLVIKPLSEIGEVTVIGGLVRDLAFYGPSERPISDIDLVVNGSPSMVAAFATRAGAIPNKFGGFGLETAAFKADFWSLSSTWARRAGHVSMRKSADLIKCTFFDWDAVVYSTKTRKISAIDGYLDRLRRRVLDLNLEPNPSIKGNLVRALRRVMMWDVRVGPNLSRFIDTHLFLHPWNELVEAEKRAFRTSFLENFHSAEEYYMEVLRNPLFRNVGRDDLRQVSLFHSLPHHYYIPTLPEIITAGQFPTRRRRRIRSETPDLFDE